MSEDRTQAPSNKRRQEARQRGIVARSPELTAAVGLLAALALLGRFGGPLVEALVAAVRAPLEGDPSLIAAPGEVADELRRPAWWLALPLGAILGGAMAAAIAAHQSQVGGLWAPGLLAPDPRRLWAGGLEMGAGLLSRAGRGAWSLAKTALIVAVAAWAIRFDLPSLNHLAGLDAPALARAAGSVLCRLAWSLAVAMVALGLLDYVLQRRRLEERLRLTPDEHREEQKAIDGDPAHRAQRRQVARARLRRPADALAGATLALTGPAGLTVLLAGGPPPRARIAVRSLARGASGLALRREAARAGLPLADAPALARHLARGPAAGRSLPPSLADELAALWPSERRI